MKHVRMSANLLKMRANFVNSTKKPEDIELEFLKPEDKYDGNIGLQTIRLTAILKYAKRELIVRGKKIESVKNSSQARDQLARVILMEQNEKLTRKALDEVKWTKELKPKLMSTGGLTFKLLHPENVLVAKEIWTISCGGNT